MGADYGKRVESKPITGVWWRSPQRGSGTEPLVGVRKIYVHFYTKEGPNVYKEFE